MNTLIHVDIDDFEIESETADDRIVLSVGSENTVVEICGTEEGLKTFIAALAITLDEVLSQEPLKQRVIH